MLNSNWYIGLGVVLSLLLVLKPNRFVIALTLLFHLVLFSFAMGWHSLIHIQPVAWSQALNVALVYDHDGLARLFLILITGIGVLIFFYAAVYCQHHPQQLAKLLSLLQLFSVAMIGLVWMDHMIGLFVFWELTSITSYLLIQFDETQSAANQAAFNALFISVLGGLAMLAGFILMYLTTQSWSISVNIQQLSGHLSTPYMTVVMVLIVLGAVTKSAQFPFHFWLPGAMKAPTPVSAYLHSATMVNAGIYLLARFHPLFASSPIWYYSLALSGLVTMVIAACFSLFQDDLKALLAYTTLFALGSMVYLLASDLWLSAEAMAVFLLFHGIYKAAAFMLVGTMDKEYGTRRLSELRGVGRHRPLLGASWALVMAAMAGWPPLYGFVVKQMTYEAKLAKAPVSFFFLSASLFSSLMLSATGFKCLWRFFENKISLKQLKKLALGLLAPTILVLMIIAMNFINGLLSPIIKTAADNIVPLKSKAYSSPSQWVSTLFGVGTFLGGLGLFYCYHHWAHQWPKFRVPDMARGFQNGLAALINGLGGLANWPQKAGLSVQMGIFISCLAALMLTVEGYSLHEWAASLTLAGSGPRTWAVAALIVASVLSLAYSRVFLMNMVSLSVLGLALSFFFLTQGAPDVAMTQLLIEILTVVILVLALRGAHLYYTPSTASHRWPRLVLATLAGLGVSVMLWQSLTGPFPSRLKTYFIHHSYALAHGKNVVNVILVDFRAFDTLGEVLVVLGASVGVWLLARPLKRS